MRYGRLAQATLAAIGMGALLAYIIACRPAWSPDGSKILFPYYLPDAEEVGVALFDRQSGEVRCLQVNHADNDEWMAVMPTAQWTGNGSTALLSWLATGDHDDGTRVCLLLPMATGRPVRCFAVPGSGTTYGRPMPEVGGKLVVGGEQGLTRVDLGTGKVEAQTKVAGDGAVLAPAGERVLFVRKLEDRPETYEFGTVKVDSLELRGVLFMDEGKVGELLPFMAASRDGKRIAMPTMLDNKPHVLIVAGEKVEKTLPVSLPGKKVAFGNMAWSADGKRLFAAALATGEGEKIGQVGVLDISVETGNAHMIPIASGADDGDDTMQLFFQISLSPDGKTLAASTCCLPKLAPGERALYLVSLEGEKPEITKVAPPRPQGLKASE